MAYVTAPDQETAWRISRAVLEKRLAACANLTGIESLYWWKGRLEESKEILVIFKTRRSLVRKLIAEVRKAHPYDVPCVVSYGMETGLPDYLAWIDAETRHQR
jgi:periplasmic divalent cation tolerance protein